VVKEMTRSPGDRGASALPDEGRMTLVEHLRELRKRLFVCILATLPGAVAGWIFYDQVAEFLVGPFCEVRRTATGQCQSLSAVGLLAPFNIQLTVSVSTGLFIAAPVWLYQIWAFVTPGLYRNERRWTLGFLFTSIPLFFAGAALCYWILPKAVGILLSFTPRDVQNIVSLSEYLTIVLRLVIVFGLAFELPVFVVILNLAGLLPAHAIRRAWRWIVLGIMVFAAAATPTGDPFTMFALAGPLFALVLVSYGIAALNDRRRRGRSGEPDYDALADDAVSPLDDD